MNDPGSQVRTAEQRRKDMIARLERDQDVWIATAGPDDAAPHLVPVSLCWYDNSVIVAVAATSKTAKNAAATQRAHLAVGNTRDVVMIDANATLLTTDHDNAEHAYQALYARTGWHMKAQGDDA